MIELPNELSLDDLREMQPRHERMLRELREVVISNGGDSRSVEIVRARAMIVGVLRWIVSANGSAQESFLLAAEFAQRVIGAKAAAPIQAMQVNAEYSPDTGKEYWMGTELDWSLGEARMSIVDYNNALSTLWSFGSDEALAEAARVSEADYRSPGIVMSEAGFKAFRAEKLLALGEEAPALALIGEIFGEMEPIVKVRFDAVRALAAGDREGFGRHFDAASDLHRKWLPKKGNRIEDVVWYAGMMLSRLALRRGIRVPERDHLPLRFAPWYVAAH